MAKRPDLTKIKEMMTQGESFSLTPEQYEELTGTNFPKDDYYLRKRSPVSRCAEENGFCLKIETQHVEVEIRTLCFEIMEAGDGANA